MSVAEQLRLLSVDLDKRGYTARVQQGDNGLWGIHVANPSAPEYSDFVHAGPDRGGVWWLWWSWKEHLTLLADIDVAADTIAAVLEPIGS